LSTYKNFEEVEDRSKIYNNEFFGYTKVRVEQPKKEDGEIVRKRDGSPKPDSSLRDYERIPFEKDIEDYFEAEVKPHLPEAWLDDSYHRVGYEINFTKYFYKYQPLRSLKEITQDLLKLEEKSADLLKEIVDEEV